MPTYEYICEKCDHQFEFFQAMTDKPLSVCPKDRCPQKKWGKGRVKRTIGAGAGLLFKGSGFYITDYRSEGYREAAKKESTAPASTSSDAKAGSSGAPTPASGTGDPKPKAKPAAPAAKSSS